MTDIKGARLYVNLGASQVRRLLKGRGHGVRKVQSAGRNQAVIIHTATGQHLRELEAVFAGARCAADQSEIVPVASVRNLGPTSAAWLRDVGVQTRADLARLGPAVAYRLVKQQRPGTSLNLLWAMAAGLAGKDWRELSPAEKNRLLRQVEEP